MNNETIDMDSYIERLVVVVLRDGFANEGANYANTEGGQFWCDVAGIDPDVAYRLASPEVDLWSMFAEATVK